MIDVIEKSLQNTSTNAKFKLIIPFISLLLVAPMPFDQNIDLAKMIEILPIKSNNNPYMEKLLDAIAMEESSRNPNAININRNRKGKEISRDMGEYQHNSKSILIFANCYNDGRMYNPRNSIIARRITRQLILDNYTTTKSMKEAVCATNCGLGRWIRGAPKSSKIFADRIMKRFYASWGGKVHLVSNL